MKSQLIRAALVTGVVATTYACAKNEETPPPAAPGAQPAYPAPSAYPTGAYPQGGYPPNAMPTPAPQSGPQAAPQVGGSGGKKPIAIDMDGNGLHFTNVDDSNVFFDVNGDGWRRRISWMKPGDGLLAYDRNADGKIDRFDEISFVPYAPTATTDMAALAQAFDTNGNGVLEAGDEAWASFGVWQDADEDGQTDAGEFVGLNGLGITGINLTTNNAFSVIDGQTVHGTSTATLSNGGTLTVADVTLTYRNETRITQTNPDGSTTTSVVQLASSTVGTEFVGTEGNDIALGTLGSDRYTTGAGNDGIADDGGDDFVEAGAGDDLIATGTGIDFVDAGTGNDSAYGGDERDWLSKFARHRNGVFCTDAEDYGRGLPHPAAYGAFPRILSKFVREDGVLSLEEAVRKMTSYPASIFGLQARGEIRRGAFADLVMLDPRRVNDRATFEKPRREATGIKLVIINGQVVLENGKLTNELPGRVIRHSNHLRAG